MFWCENDNYSYYIVDNEQTLKIIKFSECAIESKSQYVNLNIWEQDIGTTLPIYL